MRILKNLNWGLNPETPALWTSEETTTLFKFEYQAIYNLSLEVLISDSISGAQELLPPCDLEVNYL